MTKAQIITSATRAFNKVGFQLKKHSPEILAVAGVAGTVTSIVMACKATLKVNDVLDVAKENIEKIHTATETGVTEGGQTYNETDAKKDLTIVYVQTGLTFAKMYAPAIIFGAAGLTCFLTSNNILQKRTAAIAAAYATVDKSFKKYRGRVVDRFGKEVDKELRHGVKAIEVEETVIDEKGKEKKVKKTIQTVNPTNLDDYTFLFDECCPAWEKNADYNFMFLRARQQWANDMLVSQGYLFLNDVLEQLELPKVKGGQVVGWVYDPNSGVSDSYIDFGIMDMHKETTRDFINGYERSIMLEFNVDGYILDRVKF